MLVDLHLHSNVSDGLYSPKEVYDRIREAGLDLVSLTDHDSCGGYERLKKLIADDDTKLIQGVELSAVWEEKEIHILGYFRKGISEELTRFLADAQRNREQRIAEALRRLKEKGMDLTYRELLQFNHGESIGRNHLAQLLVNRGYADSFVSAFQDYLKYEQKIVPQTPTPVDKAIAVIKNSGGLSIWAHPPFKVFDKYLLAFIGMGLDGVEAFNWKKSNNHSSYYQMTAEKFGLLITAGSDWHGFPEETFMKESYYPVKVLDRFIERIL